MAAGEKVASLSTIFVASQCERCGAFWRFEQGKEPSELAGCPECDPSLTVDGVTFIAGERGDAMALVECHGCGHKWSVFAEEFMLGSMIAECGRCDGGHGSAVRWAAWKPKEEREMASKRPAAVAHGAEAPSVALSWPAAKFRAVIRAALVAASTDVERPSLCAVQIRREGRVLTVTSTDGTWLLRWREVNDSLTESGEVLSGSFSCLIARRVLESFVDATKKHLELERVLLSGEGHRWELATILDVCRHEFLQVPDSFPDTDHVIPKEVSPMSTGVAVGADMLSRVAKAFVLATEDSETAVYWQLSGGAESPLVCTSPSHDELTVVVMPRRMAESAKAVPGKEAAE